MTTVDSATGVVAEVVEPEHHHKHHKHHRRQEKLRWLWLWWLLGLLALAALLWALTRDRSETVYPPNVTYLEWAQGAWEGDLGAGLYPDGDLSYPAAVYITGSTASFFVGCHTIDATIWEGDVLINPVVLEAAPYGLCTDEIFGLEDFLVNFLSDRPIMSIYGDQIAFENLEGRFFFSRPRPVD